MKHPTPHSILTAVVAVSRVSVSELHSRYRELRVVQARRALVYLLRKHTDLSYPHIAEILGRGRATHTSQVYRYRDAERLLNEDDLFRRLVRECEEVAKLPGVRARRPVPDSLAHPRPARSGK